MQNEISVLKEQFDLYFPPNKADLAKRLLDNLLKQMELQGREAELNRVIEKMPESMKVPVVGTISKEGIEYNSKGKL